MNKNIFSNADMISPLSDKYYFEESEKYYHFEEEELTQCPFVSNEFTIEKISGDEILRISAYGLYKCFINNINVTEDILTPGWVNYLDRLPYQTYKIASLLKKGNNKIKIWLADGWYRGPLMSLQTSLRVRNVWGSKLGAIVEITNKDTVLLSSNKKWRSGLLPILESGIYYGETYDANIIPKEIDSVEILQLDKKLLIPHEIEAVKELDHIEVVEEIIDDENNIVYDFGQNVAGYISIVINGEQGSTILIEHSEVMGLGKNYHVDKKVNHFENTNYRSAKAKITYTLNGKGDEHYQPSFTFMGFRYARVKVLNGNVKIKKIVSIPISSLRNRKLEFKSKNENINKLINNTAWSQKANFIEVPTDCPQRDERLGWTGDAQIFSSTACYFYDCEKFFTKYLRDLVSEQGIEGAIGHVSPDITRNGETNDPRFITKEEKEIGSWYQKGATGWGDAITIIPWTLYRHYGNIDVLKNCQKSMIKWCEYLWSISNSPIISNPKSSTLLESIKLRGFTFGDWVPPIGDDRTPNPHIGDDCYSTIYHFISNSLLSKISNILGDEKNYIFYKNKSDEIKKAFAEEFITPSGRLAYSDQTSYAMCFVNDLIPDDKIDNAKEYFKQTILNQNFKLGTGFHGTANLLKGLKKAGLEEMIERVLLQEKLPGWMYQIKQGATSIWERWNAMAEDGSIHDPEMNSFNHYAFGSVCEFIFENIVGIKPDEENPGFKNIIIEPVIIPSLCPISFKHESINGLISVDIKIDNNNVIYKIEIPEGSRGELKLKNYNTIKVNGIDMDDSDIKLNSGVNLINFSIP